MSADAFRRVGRGGAGNFYTQKDLQLAAAKASSTVCTHVIPLTFYAVIPIISIPISAINPPNSHFH